MQELKYATSQTIIVGVFLEKKSKEYPTDPYSGLVLDWCYWRYLIKADGTVVDIGNRIWSEVSNCSGLYYLTLMASDVDIRGPLIIYIHDAEFLGKPVKLDYMVVNKNVYDSKYGVDLLKTEPEAQKF